MYDFIIGRTFYHRWNRHRGEFLTLCDLFVLTVIIGGWYDSFHVFCEPHVQHSIHLIQDHVPHPFEVKVTLLYVIFDTPWGSHQNIDPWPYGSYCWIKPLHGLRFIFWPMSDGSATSEVVILLLSPFKDSRLMINFKCCSVCNNLNYV